MNDAATLSVHLRDVRDLTAEAFASYRQIARRCAPPGKGVEAHYSPETSPIGAHLVLSNGEPRVWIIHLPHVGHRFRRIARHREATQCLGSLDSKEWLIGVAPRMILATMRGRAWTMSSPSAFRIRVIASSRRTSRLGTPDRASFMTSASSSICRTSAPNNAIFTPRRFPPNAAPGSEPTRGERPAPVFITDL
jgi:hypothetical protein